MARPMQDPNIRIDEILDAAEPLFFTKGYKKTTITDITSKMGVAKGMIYYYFRSKEEILEAIINRQTQVLLIHIKEIVSSQEKNPVQKFECIVASMFRTIQYRDGVLLNILYDEHNSHLKNKIFREGLQLLTPWLSKVIAEGVQKKDFSVSNPEIIPYFIMSILQCVMDAIQKNTSQDVIHTYFEAASRFIEIILQIPEHTLCLHIECIRRAP